MTDSAFIAKLNEQVAHEFGASQQYIAIAVHYQDQTLPQLAALFFEQAVEERNHAMMMIGYLLDAGEKVTVPGVSAPQTEFDDIAAPIALALAQERRVTAQISALTGAAREGGDYAGEQFMQWFIKEQVEEVSKMSSLLDVANRLKDNPMDIETWIAREESGASTIDPTAPAAAGGAL
ncbi:MAG: ferritin [Solirubrobacterales bacterium]|nr:ferritin [Solirubrobacterales bacterium]